MSWWRQEKRKSFSQRDRNRVWEDEFGSGVRSAWCPICKRNRINQNNFHMGHIRSLKDGGTNDLSNIRPICAQCNLESGSMDMRKYQKVYHARSKVKWGILFGVIVGAVLVDLFYSLRFGGIESSYTMQVVRLIEVWVNGIVRLLPHMSS